MMFSQDFFAILRIAGVAGPEIEVDHGLYEIL